MGWVWKIEHGTLDTLCCKVLIKNLPDMYFSICFALKNTAINVKFGSADQAYDGLH